MKAVDLFLDSDELFALTIQGWKPVPKLTVWGSR